MDRNKKILRNFSRRQKSVDFDAVQIFRNGFERKAKLNERVLLQLVMARSLHGNLSKRFDA